MELLDIPIGDQITVIILGGLGLYVLRRLFIWAVQAIANSIVMAINGQLGLDDIRVRISNLEGQLEALLTDLD